MAKSLRSKIKQKHKSIRRKTIYQPVEDARLLRLAAKQAADQCKAFTLPTPFISEESVTNEESMAEKPAPHSVVSVAERIEIKKKKFAAFKAKMKAKKAAGVTNEDKDNMEEAVVSVPKKSHKKKSKPRTAKARLRW